MSASVLFENASNFQTAMAKCSPIYQDSSCCVRVGNTYPPMFQTVICEELCFLTSFVIFAYLRLAKQINFSYCSTHELQCSIDNALGNSLMVERRTLTPLVLVRIQVPQPIFQAKSVTY